MWQDIFMLDFFALRDFTVSFVSSIHFALMTKDESDMRQNSKEFLDREKETDDLLVLVFSWTLGEAIQGSDHCFFSFSFSWELETITGTRLCLVSLSSLDCSCSLLESLHLMKRERKRERKRGCQVLPEPSFLSFLLLSHFLMMGR